MKYYCIAGEASGDLHGSNLIKSLRQLDQDAVVRGWGGEMMTAAGATVVKHYRDLAFMGFLEVVKNLRTILRNFKICKKDILHFRPDALILIDYPGFNLRIAKWAKKEGIKVFYYISPQIWAWNERRVHGIKASVDHLFVILPFEESFYKKYDYKVDFVGHPLLDVVNDYGEQNKQEIQYDRPTIALLPGSRKQEISVSLERFLQLVPQFPVYQFVIAGAPGQEPNFYHQLLKEFNADVPVVFEKTYDLLSQADAALVTSGTATLETALFEVPQVVCYRGNALSFWLAKRLVSVKYISLVNLIMDRPVVEELIQDDFNTEKLSKSLHSILEPAIRQKMKSDYQTLKIKLGKKGASERTAQLIWKYLIHEE